MIDVFEEAKSRLTMQDVARHYGFMPNRAGFIKCPFHTGDRTASMKIYPGQRGFHCFGCNRGGSVIDFVAQLYSTDALGAIRRLNDDFNLGLSVDRPQTPEERRAAEKAAQRRRELADTAKAFEAWRNSTLDKLTAVSRMAHLALKDCADLGALSEAEAMSIQWEAVAEYWAACLLSDNMSVRMDIFRDRKGVDALCSRILSSTQTKLGAA